MRNLRFFLLFVVCFNNIVTNMHNGTIAIALISMCDHSCELFLDKVNSQTVNDVKLNTTIHHQHTHDELEYLEYSGDVSAIAINWLQMNKEGMSHISSNATIVTQCTWQQIENCRRFKWSHTMKALILSASYWSSLVFQIPCGIISNELGGFWVLLVSITSIGLIDAILPTAAYFNVLCVIALRFVFGLMSTAATPASYKLINEWMMSEDKSICMAMMTASQILGCTIILMTSGLMVSQGYDWSMMFYLSSAFSIVSLILLVSIVREKPCQVKWMSQLEVNLIHADRLQQSSESSCSIESVKDTSTPWFSILANRPYQSLLFFIFSTMCVNTIYATELSLFVAQVSTINIAGNGLLNGATNLTRILAMLLSGCLSEYFIRRNYLERTNVRKIFSIILGFGQGLCLIILPFVTKNVALLSIVLILSNFASGTSPGSILPLHFDLSANYSVVLITISNTVANATGIIVPLGICITQSIFSTDLSVAWIIIFVTSGLMNMIANVVFLIYMRAERQPFDLKGHV